MKSTIIHVGLDVDDTQYHGSAALDRACGQVVDFNCRPTLKEPLSHLFTQRGIAATGFGGQRIPL